MKTIMDAVRDLALPAENRALREDEYWDEALGLICCETCHTPRQTRQFILGRDMVLDCLCRCQVERREREQEARRDRERMDRIRRMKTEGLQEPHLRAFTFSGDEGYNPAEMEYAKKYVEHWEDMRKEGRGLLLWGDVGTGKSFIAGCIANALLDRCVPVLMTNFPRILGALTDPGTGDRNAYVDCLIPRGSAGLIRTVVQESTVPVIETGAGNCHIFVDESADIDMAVRIIVNAKTQRIGVCNAAESLVVHRNAEAKLLPALKAALDPFSVEIRADESARRLEPSFKEAAEEDWGMEYLDYILSLKTVDSVDEAIRHINRYHTQHSDAIVTESKENAERFLREVDSACVYWNASTRFTDGGQFGFGAEIGISTQKLHARGPMALKELTSYKYEIYGGGQVRA